jgi:hypothetical protein
MSHAEYASRPFPVFTKLALMLRNIAALQFVFARFASLLRRDIGRAEPLAGKFPGAAPGIVANPDRRFESLKTSAEYPTIAAPESNGESDRARLIRRRWAETGIKMWNPRGAGQAVLNIQGCAGLLPVKPGETLPGYDTLEFRLVDGRIVCEGVVVDPPKHRK